MSKRFGRNQKRKMQESLTSMQKEIKHKEREIRILERLNEDDAYAVKLTSEVLGTYFAGLPVKKLDLNCDQDFVKLCSMDKIETFSQFNPQRRAEDLIHKVLMLETVNMEVYSKELSNAMVVKGWMPKGPYVAMTIDAMRLMSDHAIERLLAESFVPHLVKEIKKQIKLT